MKRKTTNKKHIIFGALLIGSLIFAGFALAENCPALTTVSGTTVIFVGELTDMGGDATASGWFEYGQTSGYGQKTYEKILTQEGAYCITVPGLSSCTTYHYGAVVRNSAGTSYGDDKTFTTACVPTVDIKANGSDGLVEIPYDSSANLTWTSTNANYCSASGDWSGSKTTSGSQPTGNLISSEIYTLTCTGSGGSVSDSVTILAEESSACSKSNSSCSSPDGYLYLGDTKLGCLNGSDWKYYKVKQSSGKEIEVELSWSGAGCNLNDLYIYGSSCGQVYSQDDSLSVKTWQGTPSSDIIIGLDGDSSNNNCQWSLEVRNIGVEELTVEKSVKNVSRGDTQWYKLYRSADPGDELLFKIVVKSTGDVRAENVKVGDILSSEII